jgi:hypothetical protein
MAYVFYSESGEIYSSPNRRFPPPEIPPETERISLLQTRSIQWSREEYPFLAWAPVNVKYTGPIMGRLACTFRSVPLCFRRDGWRIDPIVETKWARLERALVGLVEFFMEPNPRWKFYAKPSSFRYRQHHRLEEDARRAIMMSRDAFVPLIALCSWLLAKNSDCQPPERPSWVKTAVDKYDVSPEWVDLLMESQIGNMQIHRVGLIINPHNFSFDDIPLLQRFNVPVWIWWGTGPMILKKTIFEAWRPEEASIIEARVALKSCPIRLPILSTPHGHQHPPSSQPPSSNPPGFQSPSCDNSGYSYNVPSHDDSDDLSYQPLSPTQPNVTDHMQVDVPDNAASLNNTSWFDPTDNSAWLNNTGWPDPVENSSWNAVPQPPPPRPPPPGPCNSPDHNHYSESRQRVGESVAEYIARRRAQIPGQFASATPRQQRLYADREQKAMSHDAPIGRGGAAVFHWDEEFNSCRIRTRVLRCDVGSKFYDYGPDQRVFDPVYNEWDICTELDPGDIPTDWAIGQYMGNEPDDYEDSGILPANDGAPIDYDLDLAAGLNIQTEEESDILQWDHLKDTLYTRYGLIITGNRQPSPLLSASEIKKVGQTIGDSQTSLAASWQGPLTALIHRLTTPGSRPTSPPLPPLCDLDDPLSIANLIKKSNVMVTQLEHELGTRFLLEGSEYSRDYWKIMVSSAASVLQCLRGNWGPLTANIAENLFQRGIFFHTVIPLPPSIVKASLERPPILPRYRRHGYRPDPVAYMAYEAKRDDFLRLPHARAALTMGGIIWRLSIGVIGVDEVLAGASADAWQFGTRHHARGMVSSCEDTLAEGELDLICGVYKTYNRKYILSICRI